MESKTQRSIEFRYAVSLLAILTLFVITNCWDYAGYSELMSGYDVIATFGVPFVMVFKTVQPEIVWNGMAANAFLLLWIASVVAWLWHKISSR